MTDLDNRTPFEFLVSYMGFCNNMSAKPRNEWPKYINYEYINYEYLDSVFGMFTREELEILVDGEDTERNNLIESNDLQHENDLLNSIFDGDLHCYFYLGAEW